MTVIRSALCIWCAWMVTAMVSADDRRPDDASSWSRWGGPQGNFKVEAVGLADTWPDEGPPKLWSRPLGDGYSAIVTNGDRLFTMYREGDEEIVVAMSADDGATVWEHRYEAGLYSEQSTQHGKGPHATPLLLDDSVITVGFTGVMQCLSADRGELLWKHDLVREYGGKIQYYGYASSPVAYDGAVIALVGGPDHGIVALDPADGSIIWKSETCEPGYATPIVIDVDGQDQLVFFTTTEVVGVDPHDGARLWGHPVVNFCRTNCTSAIWGDDNLLWAATKGVGGTRVLKLSQSDGRTEVEEVWFDRKVRVYHWNAVRVGDSVYTSTSDTGAFLSVIDIKTGEFVEKKRGFGSTNSIYADGKLILLDSEGRLSLAEPSSGGIEIVSSVELFDARAWTVPTLVGTTLYVRDRERVMALDLAPARLAAGESTLPDAATILDGFVEATGGKAAYEKIENRVARKRLEHVGMGFEESLVAYSARPNLRYVRIESEATETVEHGVSGDVAWFLSAAAGPRLEEGEARAAHLSAAAFNGEPDWRSRYEQVKCIGEEEIDGNACYEIALTPKKGAPETRYYDKDSNLLVMIETQQVSSLGPPVPMKYAVSDYRPVDGLLIAHRVELTLEVCGSERGMIFVTESIEHDVEMSADRFTLPVEIVEEIEREAAGIPSPHRAGCAPQECDDTKEGGS